MPLSLSLDGAGRGRAKDGGRLETELVYQILQYLSVQRIRARRHNVGGLKVEDKKKARGYRYVPFGEEADPDISGIIPPFGPHRFGVPLHLEVKRPGHTKDHRIRLLKQTARLLDLRRSGAVAVLVESLDEVALHLDAIGVPEVGLGCPPYTTFGQPRR